MVKTSEWCFHGNAWEEYWKGSGKFHDDIHPEWCRMSGCRDLGRKVLPVHPRQVKVIKPLKLSFRE